MRTLKHFVISSLPDDLLDASVRLVRLLSAGAESQVLIPLVKREIILRLLMGRTGRPVATLAYARRPFESHHPKRSNGLKKEFDRPLRIDHLAQDLGMSSSAFTTISNRVNRHESAAVIKSNFVSRNARKLMLGQSLDAATAGLRVGYDDPSHFSRDYKKLFGNSPIKDVERLARNGSGRLTLDDLQLANKGQLTTSRGNYSLFERAARSQVSMVRTSCRRRSIA